MKCQICEEQEAEYDIVWNGEQEPSYDHPLLRVVSVELRDLCLKDALEQNLKDPGGIIVKIEENLLRF